MMKQSNTVAISFLKLFEMTDGIISQSNKEFWKFNKRKENKKTFSLKVILGSLKQQVN